MVHYSAARFLLVVAASAAVVYAQVPTPGQTNPNAVCPTELNDQIQACRAQVYAIESALPQGPCWSSDWPCICNVQQGLLDCYAPCPGNTPQTDIDYNNGACAGQNGYSNAAAVPGGIPYSGGVLTTTGGGPVITASSSTLGPLPETTSSTSIESTTSISSESTTASSRAVASSSSPSTTSSNTRTSSTAAQSPNVFGGNTPNNGNTGNAFKTRQGGGVQGGLLLGLVSVLLLARL